MKLYRGISLKELAKVMVGETIFPKTQSYITCNYYDEKQGHMVTAKECPNKFICTFEEDIFWYVDGEREVFLELEIPEERIFSRGYGIYSTMVWNKFIGSKDDDRCVSGEFGLKRAFNQGLDVSLKEVYVSSYSIDDVTAIKFIYQDTLPTNLGISYGDEVIKFDADYIYHELISGIKCYLRKHKVPYLPKYEYHKILTYDISLKFFTKLLHKDFAGIKDEKIRKKLQYSLSLWSYYDDNKILSRCLLETEKLTSVVNKQLSTDAVVRVIDDLLTHEDFYYLKDLYEVPSTKPIQLQNFIQRLQDDFRFSIFHDIETWDWNLVEQFSYSMMKEANLVA